MSSLFHSRHGHIFRRGARSRRATRETTPTRENQVAFRDNSRVTTRAARADVADLGALGSFSLRSFRFLGLKVELNFFCSVYVAESTEYARACVSRETRQDTLSRVCVCAEGRGDRKTRLLLSQQTQSDIKRTFSGPSPFHCSAIRDETSCGAACGCDLFSSICGSLCARRSAEWRPAPLSERARRRAGRIGRWTAS